MSSGEGPRLAGIEASANDAGGRRLDSWFIAGRKEAAS